MKKDTTIIIIFLSLIILILCYLLLNRSNNENKNGYSYDEINYLIDQRINENNRNNLPIVPDEKKDEEVTPKPVQQKPTVKTFAYSNMGGVCGFPAPGSPPCIDNPHVTLNGSYNGNGAKVTTWFEYWTPIGPGENGFDDKKETIKVVQQNLSGNVSQIIYGYGSYYRLVAQNSAGITYGETLQFSVPVP